MYNSVCSIVLKAPVYGPNKIVRVFTPHRGPTIPAQRVINPMFVPGSSIRHSTSKTVIYFTHNEK